MFACNHEKNNLDKVLFFEWKYYFEYNQGINGFLDHINVIRRFRKCWHSVRRKVVCCVVYLGRDSREYPDGRSKCVLLEASYCGEGVAR